ncbi:MAG: T9SS type A sorting domain-containing protein [Bacteroidia bacterium]|nr:T9SS type A sorting domain-containing protein [Bacteroidia bacterium]
MKKLLLTTLLFCVMLSAYASTKIEFTLDGKSRAYVLYSPSSVNQSETYPLAILLHGLGQTIETCMDAVTAQNIADNNSTYLVLPQALPEQDENIVSVVGMYNADFQTSIKTSAWGAGASAEVNDVIPPDVQALFCTLYPSICAAGKIELNANVDDVKFINTIIDQLNNDSEIYIDNDRIYMAGLSLGGAMAYKYTFSDNSQINKVAIASGFVGASVDTTGVLNIPIMVLHSRTDETIPYEGGSFNGSIENTVKSWVNKNSHANPNIYQIGSGAEGTTIYNYIESPRVLFYKIENALHNLSNVNGFDPLTEIWKFFNNIPLGVNDAKTDKLDIFPNPADDILYTSEDGTYTITDLSGRVLRKGYTDEYSIDLKGLSRGRYIVGVTTDTETYKAVLLKK